MSYCVLVNCAAAHQARFESRDKHKGIPVELHEVAVSDITHRVGDRVYLSMPSGIPITLYGVKPSPDDPISVENQSGDRDIPGLECSGC
jgi:hypothetical protein